MNETKSAALTEIGQTGLKRHAGQVSEEFLRALKWPNSVNTYKEMSENDPIIGACINAIESIVKQSEWTVVPGGDTAADAAAAAFVTECMEDMDKDFPTFVSQVMSMAPYGFALSEILYKRRKGNIFDEEMGSKYKDNRIGWRGFAFRSQDSLFEWDFDDFGRIKGIWQLAPPNYKKLYIPGWKLLHFRTRHYKDNPEGKSALRNAYKPYFFKKRLEEVEAIGIERDLNGIPTAWVPPALLSADASDEEKASLKAIQNLVRNLKQDKEAGMIFPLAYDASGNKLYDFDLMSSRGRRTHDTSGIIMRYNRDIAASMLADFILIGHENVGSFALAHSKTHMFSVAVGGYLDEIRNIMNKKAIPRLMRLNGMDNVAMPKLRYSDVETMDLEELSKLVTAMSRDAGIDLRGDDVQSYLKDQAGIPHSEAAVMPDDDDNDGDDEE